MSDAAFEVKNELEKHLVDAMSGELSSEAFMQTLFEAQIFMPVQDDTSQIKGLQRSTHARPLVIQDEEGENVMVLFTSPERAKTFVQEFPDYGGGLLTEFKWVLERMDGGMAIVVNPGWEVGIDIEPETVSQMIQALADSHLKS